MKKYVLTGGASVGKTTIINMLAAKGYSIVPEAADDIIRAENLKPHRGVLGVGDTYLFQQFVAERQLQIEEAAHGEIMFLDRGMGDGYAYCKFKGVAVPSLVMENSRNRYDKVFLLDSLDIYEYDGVRSGSLEEAKKIQPFIEEAYIFFGYTPIHVPAMKPEERVEFILKNLDL